MLTSRGCPPIYIQTGADETLLDDSGKLADLARKSGVEMTLEIVPEMKNVFQFRAGRARSGCCCGQSPRHLVHPKLARLTW